jgi:hypothetical protein
LETFKCGKFGCSIVCCNPSFRDFTGDFFLVLDFVKESVCRIILVGLLGGGPWGRRKDDIRRGLW